MQRKAFRGFAAALALTLTLSVAMPAYAQTKEEVQQTIQDLQNQKAALNNQLAELRENKESTEAYIEELDRQIQELALQIQETQDQLDATQAELEKTQAELEVAKEKEAEQYSALKARIKVMYESGDTSLIEIFLKAADISTILNATEYISKISDYDNQLLTALNETRKEIERIEAKLEEQLEQIKLLKEQLELEQQNLETIYQAKQVELASLLGDIDVTYSNMMNTEDEIAVTNQILADIIAAEEAEAARQKAAAEAAAAEAAAAAAQQQSSSGSASTGSNPSTGTSSGTSSGGSSSSGSSYATGTLGWPCGGYISSYYGARTSPTAGASSYHQGVDFAASAGSPIYAADGGTVVTSSYSSARGYYVIVSHGNGISTLYQHCSAVYVSAGQAVSKGQTIAAVGSTGISTGAHLHFEVFVGGQNVDPMSYLN